MGLRLTSCPDQDRLRSGRVVAGICLAVTVAAGSPVLPSPLASSPPASSPVAPGAPVGLTATAEGSSDANLSWTAPASDGGAPIRGYEVYEGSSPSAMTEIASVGTIPTSYPVSGLTSDTTYYFGVAAYNAARLAGPEATVEFPAASSTPDMISQTVEFGPLAARNVGAMFTLSATATSGLTVALARTRRPCARCRVPSPP